MSSLPFILSLLVSICLLVAPAAAFGAGDIPGDKGLDGYVWRHGDIATAVLLSLPISFQTNYKFTKLEKMNIYFGNWLRDYSQLIDVSLLQRLPEPLLRAVVSYSSPPRSSFSNPETRSLCSVSWNLVSLQMSSMSRKNVWAAINMLSISVSSHGLAESTSQVRPSKILRLAPDNPKVKHRLILDKDGN